MYMATNDDNDPTTSTAFGELQVEAQEKEYCDDEPEDCAIANIKGSNPFVCMFSLLKALVREGSIRQCHGHLDLRSCSSDLSSFALFRVACSLIHLKTLVYFTGRPHHVDNHRAHGSQRAMASSYYRSPGLSITVGKDEVSNDNNLGNEMAVRRMAKVCIMASKLSYETEDVIKDVVTTVWKMAFIDFFDSWNEHFRAQSTQAFMFADKEAKANFVVVAFRGTEMSSWSDWATNLDFSYYNIPRLGRVHMGYLEALGLGTRDDVSTLRRAKANMTQKAKAHASYSSSTSGLSDETVNDDHKFLAYDGISMKLKSVLDGNPNAKFFLTGHSLGGALATLFIALRLYENDGKDPRLGGVFTFGQPRVGDETFAKYMESKLSQDVAHQRKYFRVVFRTDIVPRVPSDDFIFQFKHVTPCHFYRSVKKSEVIQEQPYNNMLLDLLQPMPRLSEINEVFQILIRRVCGAASRETSIVPLTTRFFAILAPAACSHFLAYYIDVITNAPSSFLEEAT